MKDFRYHVVSLTAVFLALAVGVVLGSGPMRTALVGQQDERIGALEAEVADAEDALDAQRAQAVVGEQFASDAAASVLPGALTGTTAAMITVASAEDDDITAVRDRMVQADATVQGQLTIGDAWTDPDKAAFRNSLASTLAPDLVGVDTDEAPQIVLAHALGQALMPGVGPAATASDAEGNTDDNPQERAQLLMDLLVESDMVVGAVSGDITAVVVAAGAGAADDDERATNSAAYADLAGVLAQYAEGIVVASGPDATGDVPSAIGNSPTASSLVSTVVEGLGYYGRISTPLVLAENMDGQVAAYGPGDGRSMLP